MLDFLQGLKNFGSIHVAGTIIVGNLQGVHISFSADLTSLF